MISLFRHGQTVLNRRLCLQGWTDSPLTFEGRQNAIETALHYAKERENSRPILLLCSDLQRSIESAEIFSLLYDIEPVPCQSLRENCWGIWEGRQIGDKDVKEMLEKRAFNYAEYVPEGGESIDMLYKRVQSFVDDSRISKLVTTHDIIFHTHTNVMKVLLKMYYGVDYTRSPISDRVYYTKNHEDLRSIAV